MEKTINNWVIGIVTGFILAFMSVVIYHRGNEIDKLTADLANRNAMYYQLEQINTLQNCELQQLKQDVLNFRDLVKNLKLKSP